jgi:hypothetical protein
MLLKISSLRLSQGLALHVINKPMEPATAVLRICSRGEQDLARNFHRKGVGRPLES